MATTTTITTTVKMMTVSVSVVVVVLPGAVMLDGCFPDGADGSIGSGD